MGARRLTVGVLLGLAPTLARDAILLVNLSGRGDKDMATVADRMGLKFYCRPDCDPARRPKAT